MEIAQTMYVSGEKTRLTFEGDGLAVSLTFDVKDAQRIIELLEAAKLAPKKVDVEAIGTALKRAAALCNLTDLCSIQGGCDHCPAFANVAGGCVLKAIRTCIGEAQLAL